jgi:hypothetical protein
VGSLQLVRDQKTELMHDIEVLMLRMLPPNLRSLTRQGRQMPCS